MLINIVSGRRSDEIFEAVTSLSMVDSPNNGQDFLLVQPFVMLQSPNVYGSLPYITFRINREYRLRLRLSTLSTLAFA